MIYFLICLGACIIGAISGMGGGVIIKPILDAMGTMEVPTISFLSGCTVLAMTIMTLIRSRNSEVKIEKRKGTLLAIGGAVGGVIGKQVFEIVKASSETPDLVGAAQSFLLAVITFAVLIFTLKRAKIKAYQVENALATFVIGLVLGTLSAFLGIGGGPINLAVLYFFFAMDTKTAALNSIYIIFFSQVTSLVQTLLTNTVPTFEWSTFMLMVAGGILGGTVGPVFSKKLTTKQVDTLFIVVVVVITFISVGNGIKYLA